MTIALDVQITEVLKKEGVARELINRIQNLRKDSGFEVTDKVEVVIFASGEAREEIAASLASYEDFIATQTLALSIGLGDEADAPEGAADVEWDDGAVRMALNRK